jgi:hypothetical protein
MHLLVTVWVRCVSLPVPSASLTNNWSQARPLVQLQHRARFGGQGFALHGKVTRHLSGCSPEKRPSLLFLAEELHSDSTAFNCLKPEVYLNHTYLKIQFLLAYSLTLGSRDSVVGTVTG